MSHSPLVPRQPVRTARRQGDRPRWPRPWHQGLPRAEGEGPSATQGERVVARGRSPVRTDACVCAPLIALALFRFHSHAGASLELTACRPQGPAWRPSPSCAASASSSAARASALSTSRSAVHRKVRSRQQRSDAVLRHGSSSAAPQPRTWRGHPRSPLGIEALRQALARLRTAEKGAETVRRRPPRLVSTHC